MATALVIGGGLLAVVLATVVATETEWGRRRIATIIESQLAGLFAPGVKFRIGRLDGGIGGAWAADSVSLKDSAGRTIVSIRRASTRFSTRALLSGDIHLGVVELDGVRAFLEQRTDGSWNVNHLGRASSGIPGLPRTRRGVVADSVVLRDGQMETLQLDTNPAQPKIRRAYTAINMALGRTILSSRDSAGGGAPVRAMQLAIDSPPVALVAAAGDVRWWSDSLQVAFPVVRLPASRANVRGVIAWPARKPLYIALDVRADEVSVVDVRWMSKLFPTEGTATATVGVRSVGNGSMRYDVRAFDLHARTSHVSGSMSIAPGPHPTVRDLALTFQPLDLDIVRNVFGDSILKPAWRGALHGRVVGRGGSLDSLLIDTIAVTFEDARVPGARSRASAAGALDVAGNGTRLVRMAVHIDSLDIRTLGAVMHAADSLRGSLTGHVALDGPTNNLHFTDLWMQHVDDGWARSTVSGSGRIASDNHSRWFDATLALDTIAVATLFRDLTTLPLQGTAHGTLALSATGDIMAIDATVSSGAATAHVAGTTLLDSARTTMDLKGTMAGVDPRTFIARREIPATRLSGAVELTMDDGAGRVDRHAAVRLDTTSQIGDSKILAGAVRFGLDSGGFHLDTADIRTTDWQIAAEGRLSRTGVASDSVTFTARFDSLGVLRTMLLDSTGAPRFQAFEGRLNVDSGVVVGSFESASLRALFGAENIRIGTIGARRALGRVRITDLPDHATGLLHATVDSIARGTLGFDLATVDVLLERGERARFAATASTGDTIRFSAGAEVTWPDSVFRIQVDSINTAIGAHRWRLVAPVSMRSTANTLVLDTLVMRSDHGASILVAGSFPERGVVDATARVSSLGFEEVAFLGLFPADLSGRFATMVHVTGTRDAPIMTAVAALDSIRSEDRNRPALSLTASYEARKAHVALAATIGGRRVLDITGDIPLDLSLRSVDDRIVEAPMMLAMVADSLTLAAFEALAPSVTGLGGSLHGAVNVSGSLRHPRGRGTLALRDGSFELPKYGLVGRDAVLSLELAGDSVLVKQLRLADGDSPRDTASVTGVVRLAGRSWSEWIVDLQSTANRFRVMDDPRIASAEADWQLAVNGPLAEPRVSGRVRLPYAVFTIGPQRRAHSTRGAALKTRRGIPRVTGVIVSLGNDVRLKSRDANVQLSGEVELFGPLDRPWISGSVLATRGTYRVDLGLIKRTFRVDSGSVILEGTPDIPAALDIFTSYTVRRADQDDIHVGAHLYGTSERPRLDLTSDLGSAGGQSEIISYLVFGQSSFAAPEDRQSGLRTASAALVPSIGGLLEGVLGTVLPFFQTLQVTSLTGEGTQSVIQSPVEGLLNSFAITGGRQLGTDSFFSLSGGACRSSHVSATNSAPFWGGAAFEYRPKRTVGGTISIDPGPAPCASTGNVADKYQIGFDLSYEWKFGGAKKKP